jgi:hypothetical protein
MKADGLAAMLHDLLAMDLGGWHPSLGIPKTRALADQKALSLDPASKWWMGVLESGALPILGAHGWPHEAAELGPEAKGELVADYDRFLKANRLYSAKATHKALATAGRALGLDTAKSRDGRDRVWTLPPLAESRRLFEERLGTSDLFDC